MQMKVLHRCFWAGLVLLLFCANLALADIYFTYTVETDRDVYLVGDTVHWKIHAGVEGQTEGIAGFDLSLYESMNESMNEPFTEHFFDFQAGRLINTFIILKWKVPKYLKLL